MKLAFLFLLSIPKLSFERVASERQRGKIVACLVFVFAEGYDDIMFQRVINRKLP